MKKKFCVKCGEETEELVESLCKSCFSETKEWTKIPDRLQVTKCKGCRRKKVEGWVDMPLRKAILKSLEKGITSKGQIESIDIEIQEERSKAVATVKGKLKGVEMETKKEIDLKIEESLCGECKKINTGYFEATVQVRIEDGNTEKILDDCEEILRQRKTKEAMVSGVEERKNGFDILMPSNSAAKYLTKELAKRYNVERKESKTLKGLEDGHKTYRSTYLVRILGS
ncbi:MAG: NMD3-related protein [Candidatus Aenigmatarchaeota archaeon]